MWSLISQGKSSSFIGLPWDLFVEKSRKSAFKSGEQWEVLRLEEGAVIIGKNGVEKHLPLGVPRPARAGQNFKDRAVSAMAQALNELVDQARRLFLEEHLRPGLLWRIL